MFSTSFGFHLLSLTNLVNKPTTLLSLMTKSSWCSTLLVFPTALETDPTFLTSF